MPCPHKKGNPGDHREHTEIKTKRQLALFGAEYARRKAGKKRRMSSISKAQLRSHLKEWGSRGK